jgi:molecular chaperone GrpE
MNDKPDESANGSGSAQIDSAQAQAGNGQGPQAADQAAQIIAALGAENADLKDKLLRVMAEMENFRRRAEREKGDVAKYAVSEFARDVVGIGDNLRRAIEAAQKEPLEHNPALRTLLEGVEVTEREMIKVFERHGVTRFDPLGDKFDPHVHEAMVKVDVPNVPADIIVQVLQAGYKINDRVLRPAAVILAKGGPFAQAQPEAEPDGQGGAEDREAYDREHAQLKPVRDHDPDVMREATGAPRGPRPGGEKRASTVTKPVTEGSAQIKKDDLISSFGKRLESGNQ